MSSDEYRIYIAIIFLVVCFLIGMNGLVYSIKSFPRFLKRKLLFGMVGKSLGDESVDGYKILLEKKEG